LAAAAGHDELVSCSALRQVYRDWLRKQLHGKVHFILLNAVIIVIFDNDVNCLSLNDLYGPAQNPERSGSEHRH
jgi:hypothetical protein